MGLPSGDDGELPSDDDGLVELPSGDWDDGGASSSQGIAKRRRRGPAQQRGRVDGDVSDLPEEAVNEESVATGDIDLPEEVANDELDDLFVDVATASPKKEDRSLAKTHRRKKKHARVHPGPTAADIQATLVQGRAPDVEAYLGRSLGGALQDDVMELFSPPRILEYTAILGLRGDLSADLASGWDLSLEQDRANLLTEIVRRRPKIVFLEPPLHLVLQALELELEAYPSASSRATSGGIDGPLRVLPPDHAHPTARWPGFRPRAPARSDFVETPAGPGCAAPVSWYSFC